MPRTNSARRGERGSILVLSLLLLTLMMVFVGDALQVAQVEYEASVMIANEVKLEAALRYGYELARARISQDGIDTDIDSLAESWNTPIETRVGGASTGGDGRRLEVPSVAYREEDGTTPEPGIDVVVEIEDEDRKWPLGILVVSNEAQQRRRRDGLVGVIDGYREKTTRDVGLGDAERMADLILAFIQRKEHETAGPVPRASTKSALNILSASDLALIPEIPDALMYDQSDENGNVFPGLLRFLTISTDLQVNVNTAPLCVLRGLFRADDRIIADNIYDYRVRQDSELARDPDARDGRGRERDRPPGDGPEDEEGLDPSGGAIFQKVEDVRTNITGFPERVFRETSSMMTVQSSAFSIWVTAKLGRAAASRRYIVRRNGRDLVLVLSEKIDRDYRPRFRIKEDENTEGLERRNAAAERDRERRFGGR
jgi:type II secretory pathway component PulK